MSTIGGHPDKMAYSWNAETYRAFGLIIENLMHQAKVRRRKGYIDYYELRRNFLRPVWEDMIVRLDEFRTARGFKTISLIVAEISGELVTTGSVRDSIGECSDLPPLTPDRSEHETVAAGITQELDAPIQLSLF